MRKLQDYLLTLLMEESSDIIKASSKIIRYGKGYKFQNYREMTTEDVLRDELIDAITVTLLLNLSGMQIAPNLVEDLLKDDSMFIDVSYRINNILKFIENNLINLQLDKEKFREFDLKTKEVLNNAKTKLKEIEKSKLMK